NDGRIDPLTFIYESLGTVSAAAPFGAPTVLIEDVQFNRRRFLHEWPRRPWPFRKFDRMRAERLQIFKKTVYEELDPSGLDSPGEKRTILAAAVPIQRPATPVPGPD